MAILAVLFGLVTTNALLGQASIAQQKLEDRSHALQLQLQQLELSVAQLQTPANIAARAAGLGLVPATNAEVLVRPTPARPSATRSARAPG
jgi:cell division protein FtsL